VAFLHLAQEKALNFLIAKQVSLQGFIVKISCLKLLCCALLALSLAGRASQAQNAAPLEVGSNPPPFSIAGWWDNRAMPNAESGKVYVVNFWMSKIAPSIASLPHLLQLQQKYGEQGAVFTGISIDPRPRDAAKYLEALGHDLPVYFGFDNNGQTWNAWGAAAGATNVPATFLVGKDGKIAWMGLPGQLEPALQKALEQENQQQENEEQEQE
jgi:thiol-disulfide isomerase/thioredoxin